MKIRHALALLVPVVIGLVATPLASASTPSSPAPAISVNVRICLSESNALEAARRLVVGDNLTQAEIDRRIAEAQRALNNCNDRDRNNNDRNRNRNHDRDCTVSNRNRDSDNRRWCDDWDRNHRGNHSTTTVTAAPEPTTTITQGPPVIINQSPAQVYRPSNAPETGGGPAEDSTGEIAALYALLTVSLAAGGVGVRRWLSVR
jgi:hypothetical protein